jgi:exopolysaccharide biosynthesis polyprenyl glycosylphosphotransferase
MSEAVPNILRTKRFADTIISLDAFAGDDILGEQIFLKMLCLERKRAERSGRRFVLMLLECNGLLKAHNDPQVLQKILQALANSTRETDIKGWYEEGAIIGVVFTEIGTAEGKAVAKALLTRITQVLCSTLGIEDINKIGLSFHVFPEDSTSHSGGSPNSPLYTDLAQELNKRNVSRFLKRSMDILGSLFALICFFPLFLAIAIAVRFSSKGPVVFRQKRVGQFGTPFTFFKFRSMYVTSDHTIHQEYVKNLISGASDCAQGTGQEKVYKLTNDPRVTPIGRLLRKTSLDELPQFFNVLRGEMSLVGPRPPIPYEFECYSIWQRRRVSGVKPGITGLWQVWGRSRVTFDEMVRMDLTYANTWSLWLDIKILLHTPLAMFTQKGAY